MGCLHWMADCLYILRTSRSLLILKKKNQLFKDKT